MKDECCCESGREGLKRKTRSEPIFDSSFSGLMNLVLFAPLNPICTCNIFNWRLGSLLEELLMPWIDRQRDNSTVGTQKTV